MFYNLNCSPQGNKFNTIVIEHNKKQLVFPIGAATAKVSGKVLKDPSQTAILNAYIYDRRKEDDLFVLYDEALTIVETTIKSTAGIKKVINKIIDEFDIPDIVMYLKASGVLVPASIATSFDYDKEKDAVISNDQTYIVEEYYGLIALALIAKAIYPITSFSMDVNASLYLSNSPTESMYKMLQGRQSIFNTPEMKRLYRFVSKHSENAAKGESKLREYGLKNDVISDEIPEIVVPLVFFKTLPLSKIERLPPARPSIVSAIYTLVSNSVDGQSVVKDRISIKAITPDGNDQEAQSTLEAYRQGTEFPIGVLAEFAFAFTDGETVAKNLGIQNIDFVYEVLQYLSPLSQYGILPNKGSTFIISAVVNNVFDARGVKFLENNDGARTMAAALTVAWLWERDFKILARLVATAPSSGAVLATGSKISLVPKALEEELSKYYPSKVVTSRVKAPAEVSLVPQLLTNVTGMFVNGDYIYLLPMKYLESSSKNVEVPADIKIELTKLLIELKKGKFQYA